MIKFDLTSFQCEDFTSRPSPRRTRSSPAVVLALPLAESCRTGSDTLWTSFPQLSTRPICFPSSIFRDERCGSHGGEPTSKSLSNPCVVENRRAHPRKALGGRCWYVSNCLSISNLSFLQFINISSVILFSSTASFCLRVVSRF